MKENEFVVSVEAIEIMNGANAGKWRCRFSIRRNGDTLYRGEINVPAATKEDAEKAAAGEACEILLARRRKTL